MDKEPSLKLWGQRIARLGIAFWIACAFLSLSSFRPADNWLAALGWIGGASILLGFLMWRTAFAKPELALSLRTQIYLFARPLVGLLVVIGGVVLAGATIAGDDVSFVYLTLAMLFIAVGVGIIFGSHSDRPAEFR